MKIAVFEILKTFRKISKSQETLISAAWRNPNAMLSHFALVLWVQVSKNSMERQRLTELAVDHMLDWKARITFLKLKDYSTRLPRRFVLNTRIAHAYQTRLQ